MIQNGSYSLELTSLPIPVRKNEGIIAYFSLHPSADANIPCSFDSVLEPYSALLTSNDVTFTLFFEVDLCHKGSTKFYIGCQMHTTTLPFYSSLRLIIHSKAYNIQNFKEDKTPNTNENIL